MKIAVGTTSNQKLGYLQEILDEFEIKATLIPLDVPSEISEQPISSLETKQGSINRAKNAFEKCNNADFALGIEVGYHPNKNGDYKMHCWATIDDGNGKQITCKSYSLLLPKPYQDLLKRGEYLCHYVDDMKFNRTNPITRLAYEAVDDRKIFITSAIKSALIEQYISRELNQ